MPGGLLEAAEHVRKIAEDAARRASPPAERFVILRKKPLLLESVSSDLKLSEEDDDFEIGKGLRKHLKVDDHVLVATDRDGDRVIVSTSGGGGGGKEAAEAEEAEEKAAEGASLSEGEQKAVAAATAAGLGVILHGSDPNVARGDLPFYVWVGSAEPVNRKDGDFWANTG